ncbi:MAG: GNAT family N-acetyltransferase [Acidobacteriota bacterium]|nr:GNAT family N-acetyltransferase [Acidobacteriota bacterium]
MLSTTLIEAPFTATPPSVDTRSLTVHSLIDEHVPEVLSFLAARPIHTVIMAGLIRDNGLVSSRHRGAFYACRNTKGQLEGIALIGHHTLIEARTEAALAAFARLLRADSSAYMILAEAETIKRLRIYYSGSGSAPRLICRELLLEQRCPVETHETVGGLRMAAINDLARMIPAHAAMALEDTGINPLEVDPEGFRLRFARRIEQKRVWVWTEGERLIFKADVLAETPEAAYLEGIYVNPEERGKGYGLRCLSQLSRSLLARTRSIVLLVDEQNLAARGLYFKAGYKFRSRYETVFPGKRSDVRDMPALDKDEIV